MRGRLLRGVVAVAVLASVLAVWGPTAEALEALALACVLAYVSSTDLACRRIPNRALLVALAVRAAYLLWRHRSLEPLGLAFAAGLCVALPLVVVGFLLRRTRGSEGVGGGDVKLLFVVGCCCGWWRGMLVACAACLAGATVTVLRARGRGMLSRGFPLAPYVALACWAVSLSGSWPR